MKQHFSSPETPWGKAHTPKLYLHPPLAENIVTLWPSTIVLLGEIEGGAFPQHDIPGRHNESNLPSSAMVFMYRNVIPDFKNGEYSVRQDGIPIHILRQNVGVLTMEMESFCNTKRVPTVFTKLTIRNNTDDVLEDEVGMIARTAPEFDLTGTIDPDGYFPPEPSINRWRTAPLWEHDSEKITDRKYTVYYKADDDVKVVYNDDYSVRYIFELSPRGETVLYFAFGRDKIDKDFSYDYEKKKTEEFWESELSKIRVFPEKNDPKFYAMYRSLVVQLLQMFCRPKGVNYTLLRQGSLQRLMWPGDVRSSIRALAHIGDFEGYLDLILNTYFHVMQAESGEIINFGIPWGSVTGSVLFAFGAVAMYHPTLYQKYKDNAYRAFQFVESQRKISASDPNMASGLYPPVRASDSGLMGQVWAQTDIWIIHGYALYAEGLKRQGDDHADEVKEAFWNYMGCVQKIVDRAVQEQENDDRIVMPVDARFIPEIEEVMAAKLISTGFHDLPMVNLGFLGDDTPLSRKMLKMHFETDKEYKNGLCNPYAPSPMAPKTGRRWYGSWADMEMYCYHRRIGDNERAKEILDAQLAYVMTNEYYMGERVDDSDSWFFPWCPNCSANGRTISMLCDWYFGPEEFTFYEK